MNRLFKTNLSIHVISPTLTHDELIETSELMFRLLVSIRDVATEPLRDTDDDFDAVIELALKVHGIGYILDAHLNGTTMSGSKGLIHRFRKSITRCT